MRARLRLEQVLAMPRTGTKATDAPAHSPVYLCISASGFALSDSAATAGAIEGWSRCGVREIEIVAERANFL